MQPEIERALSGLPLGPVRYYETAGSTNDLATTWVAEGAPDLSLVVADEQTTGRGRQNRQWFTPPGSALAISVVLRPSTWGPEDVLGHYSALGALAVHEALSEGYGLSAAIKWPNDILLGDQKVGGVLAEAQWEGSALRAVIVGMGVNVAREAVPAQDRLRFPATSVESVYGAPVDRWSLLAAVMAALMKWRRQLSSPFFLEAWQARLAYLNEMVIVGAGGSATTGRLLGLTEDGQLRLATEVGEQVLRVGEVSLRPVDRDAN